jgi:hypothetical protein
MRNSFLFITKIAAPILALVLFATSCNQVAVQPSPSSAAVESPSPMAPVSSTATPTVEISDTPTATIEPTTVDVHSHDEGVLYQDDFEHLDTGWPELVFDNSYLGYHEPEWYHIEVQDANDSEIVAIPEMNLDDFTMEVAVFTEMSRSETQGDYRYGLVFRRSGNQYYAFVISPVTKEWFVLKGSPTALEVLQEGSNDSIQGLGVADTLRVDAQGADFFFHINGQPVGRVNDADYAAGELGFIVQTLDNPRVHIHYDSVQVREVEAPQLQQGVLYQDDFKHLDTGWPELVFDNSYLGYHEPEWYHIEVQDANDSEIVAIPEMNLDDFTMEVAVFTEMSRSETQGDYRYGLVFRRSGNQYYAFVISPVTKEWFVLKGSPTALEVLQEGSDDSIQGLGVADTLRVDARGADFFFHVNGQPVGRVNDADYTGGELGFIVQTLDNPRVHIHYDSVQIREVEAPQWLCSVDTQALNLRSGPGLNFRILRALLDGDQIEPLQRTADELWIQVREEGDGQTGWVANDRPYITCNLSISDLPVSEP